MRSPELWRAVNTWFVLFAGFMATWQIVIAVNPGPPGYYADPLLPCIFLASAAFMPAWVIANLYRRILGGGPC